MANSPALKEALIRLETELIRGTPDSELVADTLSAAKLWYIMGSTQAPSGRALGVRFVSDNGKIRAFVEDGDGHENEQVFNNVLMFLVRAAILAC